MNKVTYYNYNKINYYTNKYFSKNSKTSNSFKNLNTNN